MSKANRVSSASSYCLARLSLGYAVVFIMAFSACSANDDLNRADSIDEKIIRGTLPASNDQLASFVVNLGNCTGTLVSNHWVLTASHCLGASGPISQTVTTFNGATAVADWVVRHPEAPPLGRSDSMDVALMHLSSPLGTAVAPLATNDPTVNQTLRCYGYGLSSAYYDSAGNPTGAGFGTLRTALLTVDKASTGDTRRYHLIPNSSGQIQWQGDSGGPCFDIGGRITGVQSNVGLTGQVGSSRSLTVTAADQTKVTRTSAWIRATIAGGQAANTDPCTTAPSTGRSDLAGAWQYGQTTQVAEFWSNGATFGSGVQEDFSNGGWMASQKWTAGDFDGDGLTDLAAVWNDFGMASIAVRKSTGGSLIQSNWITQAMPFQDGMRVLAGNFDADKFTDIAIVWADHDNLPSTANPTPNGGINSATAITIFPSSGSSFLPPENGAMQQSNYPNDSRWVVGDFDGDGFDDLATIWRNSQVNSNTITVRRSNGAHKFPSAISWLTPGGWMSSTQWLAGKFTGHINPRTNLPYWDLAAAWNYGGVAEVAVYPSTDGGFSDSAQWDSSGGGWMDYAKWVAGDFNGDGLTDLAAVWPYGNANSFAVRKSNGSAASFSLESWAGDGGWMDSTVWCAGTFHR